MKEQCFSVLDDQERATSKMKKNDEDASSYYNYYSLNSNRTKSIHENQEHWIQGDDLNHYLESLRLLSEPIARHSPPFATGENHLRSIR